MEHYLILIAMAIGVIGAKQQQLRLNVSEDEWMRNYLETLKMAETSPIESAACSMHSQNLPSIDEREFFVCKKPSEDVRSWPWPEIGLYIRERCKPGYLFSPRFRICRQVRTVRRQQVEICIQFPSACNGGSVQPVQPVQPIYPVQPVQPVRPVRPVQPIYPPVRPIYPVTQRPVEVKPCPFAGQSMGSGQGACSWMIEKLAANPSDPYSFLQCAPTAPGEYCGGWVRMPCAKGTRFDVNEQVCVHDERGGGRVGGGVYPNTGYPGPQPVQPPMITISVSCSAGQMSVGFCGQGGQCPGYSNCNMESNTCCQNRV